MPANCILYYITDRTAFSGDESAQRRRLLEKIREAASARVNYIQLREKDLSSRELESLAREAVSAIREGSKQEPATALLINSRSDVAMAVQADGVHLRSDDLSPQEVRAMWKRRECGAGTLARELAPQSPLIGVSCHSAMEVTRAAAADATFAVLGPVFEKKETHPGGLKLLQEACRANIPVLALGGVTLANARSCLDAGAAGVAAIRLFQENDIATVAEQLRG